MDLRVHIHKFTRRRWFIWLLTGTGIAIVLIGVTLSPLGLAALNPLIHDWNRGSEIGQTYGAASALLSALAVVGVAVSLLLGVRQTRHAQIAAARNLHMKMIELAFADPIYIACWGGSQQVNLNDQNDLIARRSTIYVNLIINHWQAMWDLGLLDETDVRAYALTLFNGEAGRQYWIFYGQRRLSIDGRRVPHRKFLTILDEAYRYSVTQGPAFVHIPTSPATENPPADHNESITRRIIVAFGLAWLVIRVTRVAFRHRSRR